MQRFSSILEEGEYGKKLLVVLGLTTLLAHSALANSSLASLTVVNYDNVPCTVIMDYSEHIATVIPAAAVGGDSITVQGNGQSATANMNHGRWKIVGDGSDDIEIMIYEGHDYILYLQPFTQGYNVGLLGMINDSYSSQEAALYALTPRSSQPIVVQNPYAPQIYNPYHGGYDGYYDNGSYDRDSGSIGAVIGAGVVGAIIGGLINDDRPPPPPPPGHYPGPPPPPPGHHPGPPPPPPGPPGPPHGPPPSYHQPDFGWPGDHGDRHDRGPHRGPPPPRRHGR